jgi:hypothetical protein
VGHPLRLRLSPLTDPREQAYARLEHKNVARTAATVRRGPVSLVAVCLLVALSVGVVAAVDLRRLQTPRGTAMAWTGAAVFGDCTAYRELSRGPRDGDADERCLSLREQTEDARARAGDVEIELVRVEQDGDRADAVVRVRLPERTSREVPLELRRDGDRWRVELTRPACAVLACP